MQFDERRGLGVIERADGTQFGFHCTQIADGSRTVPVSAKVRYRRIPAHLGTYEAASVTTA